MALVTLRDLTTNKDIDVPPEGYIFGRAGGDADIQLEDNSISRRQARVSLKGGLWLLETLAVPQGQRAPRPVQLEEGATFLVGQSEFEVVRVEAEDEEAPDPGAKTFAPQKGKPGPAPAAPAKKAPPAPANAKTAAAPPPKKTATAASNEAADDGVEKTPVQKFMAMFVAAPKGLAYYLLNVPKMLLNPVGTVRKAIEELPAEPMEKTELIGYALPSLVVTFLLPSFASGIGMLLGPGHVFSFSAFVPIVPAIVALVASIVVGFVWHPLNEWVITKLKGESDARSRTNYFLQTMTIAIIVAVPKAVGILMTSIAIPFLNMLGPVLLLVAGLVTLYVNYHWLVSFKVVKWVFIVVKVAAVLTVLGAGFDVIGQLRYSIARLGSGGGSDTTAVAAPSEGEEPAAEAAAAAGLEEMPTDPEELKVWTKKRADAAIAKAQADAKKAQAAAVAEVKKNDEPKGGKETPPEPKKTEKPEEKQPEPVAAKEPTKEPVKETPPPPKEEPVAQASGAYGAFARRRDAVEKLFENDPTVLSKSTELQKLYGDYLEAAYDLDKKWGKDTAKNPDHAKLNARLRDAELYGKTGKIVDSLAGKLGVR